MRCVHCLIQLESYVFCLFIIDAHFNDFCSFTLIFFVFEKEGIMLTMVGQFAVFFLCFRGLYGYIFFRMRVLIEDKKDIVFV